MSLAQAMPISQSLRFADFKPALSIRRTDAIEVASMTDAFIFGRSPVKLADSPAADR